MTIGNHVRALRARANARWRRGRAYGFLLEVGLATLIGVGMACFIQLALGEEFATRGYARVYAPFSGWFYGDRQQAQTTVLLIDDAALSDAGQTWPPRYSYHARLAKALARYRPKAVFFDIYFNQVRDDPSLPVLVDALCALQQQGVQVFLGAVPDARGDIGLRTGLEELDGKCLRKVGLEYTPDSLDRLAWNYPMREEGELHARSLPSAALAIYEQAYGRHLPGDDGELALTWGTRSAAHGLRWVEEIPGRDGARAQARAYCRKDMGWREAFLPAGIKDHQPGADSKPLCVFHDTLYAGDLATGSEEEETVLRKLLQGRTVMIGAALANSGDRVLSPLHGRIPGVYLHAMALDNLLTYDERYPREVRFAWKADGAHLRFYFFILLSVTTGTLVHRKLRACRQRQEHASSRARRSGWAWMLAHELAWKLLKAAALVLTVCAAIYVGQCWFRIGLMAIVDIVFFTLAAEWLELNEKLLRLLDHHKTKKKRLRKPAVRAARPKINRNNRRKHEPHHTQ